MCSFVVDFKGKNNLLNLTMRDLGLILVFTLITTGFLTSNPGFYSHDELQKLDHVSQHGFANYLKSYVTIKQGEAFGTPVRPFAFLIQGLLSFAMTDYPILIHFFDVLTHAAVAILLYLLVLRYSSNRILSLVSALIFVINPMTTLATGWSAALMDRWYILFGLLAFLNADRYVNNAPCIYKVLALLFWASLAMLSKETALILPGTMVLMLIHRPILIRNRRFWVAFSTWMLPVILFFLYRLPAIISSFGHPQVASYKASITNVPDGILVYFSYPFLITLTEAVNLVFVPRFWIIIAFIFHWIMVGLIWRLLGAKNAVFYLFFYFLFLTPVLLIPIKAAHYLYGSSLIFSIALGYLITHGKLLLSFARLFGLLAIFIILIHSFCLQLFVYHIGSCMNKAMISANSSYISLDRPSAVDFRAEVGAPAHILYRFVTGRNQIGNSYPIKLTVSPIGAPKIPNSAILFMDQNCFIYSDSDRY